MGSLELRLIERPGEMEKIECTRLGALYTSFLSMFVLITSVFSALLSTCFMADTSRIGGGSDYGSGMLTDFCSLAHNVPAWLGDSVAATGMKVGGVVVE